MNELAKEVQISAKDTRIEPKIATCLKVNRLNTGPLANPINAVAD